MKKKVSLTIQSIQNKFRIVLLSNITFFVNKLKDVPLGMRTELLNFITQNHGYVNVSGDRNMCFFVL